MKKAAELGDTDSQQRYAQCLASGVLGVTRDPSAAIRWLQTAAVQGHPKAMFQWAQLLATGSLVLAPSNASPSSVTPLTYPSDPKSAFEWLEKSARAGYVDAARELALAYLQGIPPLHIDIGLAVDWFKRAADSPTPDHESTAYLGELYKTNQVPEARNWTGYRRLQEASRYLTRAADNGVAVAQRSLGFLFAYGVGGLQKDVNQAAKWLSVAAESSGLLDAQLMVTILAYQQGGDAGRDAAIEIAKRLRDSVISSGESITDDVRQQLMSLHEDPSRALKWIANYHQRTGMPWLGGSLNDLFIQAANNGTTSNNTSSSASPPPPPPSVVLNISTAATNTSASAPSATV
jgi:TPR repeat protein